MQIELELGSPVKAAAFEEARKVLLAHSGAAAVVLQVGTDNGEAAPRLRSRSRSVSPDVDTIGQLQRHGTPR